MWGKWRVKKREQIQRWEFIKERFKEKKGNSLTTKKKVRFKKKRRKHTVDQEKKARFKILLFFFYKFPPQELLEYGKTVIRNPFLRSEKFIRSENSKIMAGPCGLPDGAYRFGRSSFSNISGLDWDSQSVISAKFKPKLWKFEIQSR